MMMASCYANALMTLVNGSSSACTLYSEFTVRNEVSRETLLREVLTENG